MAWEVTYGEADGALKSSSKLAIVAVARFLSLSLSLSLSSLSTSLREGHEKNENLHGVSSLFVTGSAETKGDKISVAEQRGVRGGSNDCVDGVVRGAVISVFEIPFATATA
jgi:hypothetical protein